MINITDGFMSLMFENGDIREDLRLPEGDLGKEIQNKFDANDEFLVSFAMCFKLFFANDVPFVVLSTSCCRGLINCS